MVHVCGTCGWCLRLVTIFAILIFVQAQPDETPCDNNAAYDVSAGTATCNGVKISVKKLVCGDGFSQTGCVAKWNNPSGNLEEYFFMGAGAGMSATQLPEECFSKFSDTGLAMVQYYPNGDCYPAADLQGTTATYTSDGAAGVKSVTLNFASHDDGSAWRDGYIKITCGTSQSEFTTTGDLNEPSTYEVQVTYPCVGGSNANTADGIDDGGVLLIVVFVGGFIYFVGGATYLSQVKKVEGNQRIPHFEFWSSLPGLVKEGALFCKGKILGTVSYAEIP